MRIPEHIDTNTMERASVPSRRAAFWAGYALILVAFTVFGFACLTGMERDRTDHLRDQEGFRAFRSAHQESGR